MGELRLTKSAVEALLMAGQAMHNYMPNRENLRNKAILEAWDAAVATLRKQNDETGMETTDFSANLTIKEVRISGEGPLTVEGLKWELNKCLSILSPGLIVEITDVAKVKP